MVRGRAQAPGNAGIARRTTATLAAALLLALGAHAGTAGARPLVTGITNLESSSPLAFEQTRAAGARFVRIALPWAATVPPDAPTGWNPTDPTDPYYDWSVSDEATRQAVAAGLTPVLIVDGAPAWAQRCQAPPYALAPTCNPDPGALAAFATAAARHYSGQTPGVPHVQYWQALNEPNLSLFFNPQFDGAGQPVSPQLYRTLLNAFYAAVKAVDPSDLVITAGLGPIAVPRYTIGPMRFARLLLCMSGGQRPHRTAGSCDGGVHADIFAIQPYTTGGPTHEGGPNDVELGDLPKLQRLLRAADRDHRLLGQFRHTPLWITEFSWDSKPPDPGGLPMKIETRWTAEALYRAWRAGISNFLWFSLRDDPYDPSQPFSETLQSGLYFRGATLAEDRPKKVLYAFRFPFVAYPRKQGLFFWGRTPNSEPGRVRIQLRQDGHWRQATTVRAAKNGIFQGVVDSGYGSDRRGAVRAVVHKQRAVPFGMKPVPDFPHPPFG
jgi:hypothetical protein